MTNDDIILEIAEPVARIACRKCAQTIDVAGLPVFQVVICPVCQTGQKVPAQLKHFLLFDVLGRGGMAVVYRALDRTLNRHVAIKVMRGSLADDPQYVANFLREARAAAQLNHPNIVQIYMVDEAGGHPFIVMELLDGGRLDEMIAAGRPLSEKLVLRVALQVAEGLAAAADRGLIHGDIKPANILFDRQGTAKITDFGLARFQQKPLSQGEIWGTPYYIAPEKVRERREDLRSDIYSLGATLFHALALTPPFEGETATDVVLARLKTPPPPLDNFRQDLHPATKSLIARMLEPDPAVRYPNYASLISDIQAALAAVQSGPPTTRTTPPQTPRRRAWWVALAVLALLASVVAVLVALRSRRPSPARPRATTPSAAIGPTSPPPAAATSTSPVAAAPAILPLQPFSAEEERRLAEVFELIARGDNPAAERALLEIGRQLPSAHGGRGWIALFTAVPPWLNGDVAETTRRLQRLMDARFPAQADGSPHPSALPQALARLLVGHPYIPPPGPPPPWYEPLRRFFQSGSAIQNNKIADGLTHLEAYLAAPTNPPAWPRGLQPVATALVARAREWREFRDAIKPRLGRGEGEAVLRELRDRLNQPGWQWYRTAIREEISATERAINEQRKREEAARRKAEEERRRAEEEARKEAVRAELEKVAGLRATLMPLLAQRNFKAASAAVKTLKESLQTEEGRRAIAFWEDATVAADALLPLLAERLKTEPFRGAIARQLFGGDVVAATSQGVVVLVGGAGTVERPWRAVSPRAFVELMSYATPPEGRPERAKHALGLALYAASVPDLAAIAQRAAALAVRADATLEPALREHLPNLLPAPAP
ncbi:MAG: protein kinase [Kiritimatiellae bacterium]|nr:protein kinase [Kiritimatiellia bacterium]